MILQALALAGVSCEQYRKRGDTFRVSNKNLPNVETIPEDKYIFSACGCHYIDSGHAFSNFSMHPFSAVEEGGCFAKFTDILLVPAMELVQAGKNGGGVSGDLARSPAALMHWKRRAFHVQPQLQACCIGHSALMPWRVEHHFHIQFPYGRQIRNLALDI